MPSLNHVIVLGHLGQDPDVHRFASGSSVTRLRLATNRVWTDTDGVRQTRTDWHSVDAFGQPGDYSARYLKKGDLVLVEGALRTNESVNAEGQKRYFTAIHARRVSGMSSRSGDRPDVGRAAGPDASPPAAQPLAVNQDTIPF